MGYNLIELFLLEIHSEVSVFLFKNRQYFVYIWYTYLNMYLNSLNNTYSREPGTLQTHLLLKRMRYTG